MPADTLPALERARALYARAGFVPIPPYAANSTPRDLLPAGFNAVSIAIPPA